jgi:3-phosphoshikimate 1-carboxyvinyltransferase
LIKSIQFVGKLPASKSIMNRMLIVQSFFPDLILEGDSQCDDVKLMQKNMGLIGAEEPFDCGHAGTVLRFLSFRLSRITGTHRLLGSDRLFKRPLDELVVSLRQLGCEIELKKNELKIKSQGWRPMGDCVHINSKRSSQFLTGAILSSWKFNRNIHFSPGQVIASPEYWQMSLRLMKRLGMTIESVDNDYIVKPSIELKEKKYIIEQDLSSAFAVAAFGAIRGTVVIQGFPKDSLQPDSIFPNVLAEMGVDIQLQEDSLKIKGKELIGIDFDVNLAPDMFPVLAVLVSHSKGRSRLLQGHQLKYKESDRLKIIVGLLEKMNKRYEVTENMLQIEGNQNTHNNPFVFDCLEDHRLAMAAGLVKYLGYKIEIKNANVVSKSFPEFWNIVGAYL